MTGLKERRKTNSLKIFAISSFLLIVPFRKKLCWMDALRCYQNNVKTSFSVLPSPPTRHARCMLLGYGVRTVKIGGRNSWFFFARQPLSVRRKACYKWFLLDAITTAGDFCSHTCKITTTTLSQTTNEFNSFSNFFFFNTKRFAEWGEEGWMSESFATHVSFKNFRYYRVGAHSTPTNA